ncbi:Brr6/Brl1 family protein [Sporobolomyces salmoneus]|uniref:Brr6/Brl1 family protein n=1 Tax=Sporobolomyces salmoneus TaxID=183962 RepID=UPI003181A53A
MRRFPPPPGGATTSSTPSQLGGDRSAEAPMQYEWEKPRQFPTSLFATPQRGGSTTAAGGEDGSERARKRTHYEAMDVDTPLTNTAYQPPSEQVRLEPLSFDAKKDFDRTEALGLNEREVQEVVMADDAEDLIGSHADEKENLALTTLPVDGGTRRRRRGSKNYGKMKSAGVTIETDDENDDEAEEDGRDGGFLGTLQKMTGKRTGGGGEFSFQVHHHHAPASNALDIVAGSPRNPERWLQSNTPYVLLGYLQFGSLTLLAVLVLSILFLFLYTLYTDIQSRLSSLTLELRQEILQCAKAYVDNRCEPATRIPAMERRCSDWEECMNREVVVNGKTRVVAETLAEIVNGFVDVISFKTMLFVLLTLGITIYGSSAALALLSSRASNHPQHSQVAPHYYPPPYGLPYGAGQTPWVIENGPGGGGGAQQGTLGIGAPPAGMGGDMMGRNDRKNS